MAEFEHELTLDEEIRDSRPLRLLGYEGGDSVRRKIAQSKRKRVGVACIYLHCLWFVETSTNFDGTDQKDPQ